MKKLLTTFKVLAVFSVLLLNSCRDENNETAQQESVQAKVSTADLKKETTPVSAVIPETVQAQLNESQKNIEKYLKNDLQVTAINVIGKISTVKGIEISQNLVADRDQFIAMGNIMEPSSVKIGKISDLYSGDDLILAQKGLKETVTDEIKTGTNVMEVTWNSKAGKFTTLCFYNDSGIIWDNVFGGLVMMDTRGQTEISDTNQASKVVSKWYKEWWTANWLWGSKRGEIGYQITIYYTGSSVSNADVNDWGNISLGKAKSESKILRRTGAFGQCQYALGLCTPTGSLSFNASKFSVSFSGLGSNIVANGTKSLYP
ncbi:hypothetical protein H3Z85_15755 [Chryseobacterium indologenes]|uniref:hypothetical protein n=1 Tax=Chryseobacterium TaxID=59732 RepID=UPI0003E06048|nr:MULTISPECIES: hypothetical protein [Chryseobacterium]ASE60586.1 hypothetical protein CEQ15_03205 [Chryseobacterium indologenes]ATN04701.1 hypothetical protein CRN76_04420 [Chryseobacterium indologenes]AYY86547.1 hypothetical protein EGX91_19340 [Chryseobacterium indologenes]AYZ36428.1 hypothetical protein EGY07_13040 [Chryseobacterium indologenes]MBF6645093.1 hypothetical protein [Chryseobacterium indologenes]